MISAPGALTGAVVATLLSVGSFVVPAAAAEHRASPAPGDAPGWVVPGTSPGQGPPPGTWLPWSSEPGETPTEPTVPAPEVTGRPGEAAGQLDPTFSADGLATPNFVAGYEEASAAVYSGSVVAGEANGRFQLARFLSGGAPDPSFGGDGAVQTDLTPGPDVAYDVYQQPNGRYVAVGTASGVSVAVRYLADGRLDRSFGDRGVVGLLVGRGFNFFSSIASGYNGRLVFAGRAGGNGGRMVVAAVDSSGRPDPTFSGDGFHVIDYSAGDDWAWDIAVHNGRHVLVGATGAGAMAVARVNASGALDPTFGQGGRRTLRPAGGSAVATSLAVADGGFLIAGGTTANGGEMAVTKLDAEGRYVRDFGEDGWTTVDFTSGADYAWDVYEDQNGDLGIVLAGRAAGQGGRIALARLEADGTMDASFDGDGRVTTDLSPGNDEARSVTVHRSHPAANSEVIVAGVRDAATSRARIALAVYLGS